MSRAPDQNLKDMTDDMADDTDDTRGNGGEPRTKSSEAAGPASPAARVGARLKQWGITLSYLVIAVAIIALIRTFVIQSFTIPSGSMEDTLTEGDRVTVTMYDSHDIERGDVVVFTDPDHWLTTQEPAGLQGAFQDFLVAIHIFPQDAGHHLIKRVIGMPGDHVVADGNGSLSVNGVEIHEDYLKPGRSASDVTFDITVPEGYVSRQLLGLPVPPERRPPWLRPRGQRRRRRQERRVALLPLVRPDRRAPGLLPGSRSDIHPDSSPRRTR